MSKAFELPKRTHTRIIRSARRCFAAQGFAGTSTRQIAEDAKVAQSEGTVREGDAYLLFMA